LQGSEPDEEAAREELAAAVPGFFEHVLGEVSRNFQQRVTDTLAVHQKRADELIESIRKTAAQLFDIPYRAPESTGAYQSTRQPYWVTNKWSATMSPLPETFIDRLLSTRSRLKRIRKRLSSEAEKLVIHNVENLRWATLQNVDQTFRRFTSSLDERLAETTQATHGAIQAAFTRRREQAEQIEDEVKRLQHAARELDEIRTELAKTSNDTPANQHGA